MISLSATFLPPTAFLPLPRQRRLSPTRSTNTRSTSACDIPRNELARYSIAGILDRPTEQHATSDNERRSPEGRALHLEDNFFTDERTAICGHQWHLDIRLFHCGSELFGCSIAAEVSRHPQSRKAGNGGRKQAARQIDCADVHALSRIQTDGISRATSTTFCVCSTPTLTASRRSSTP